METTEPIVQIKNVKKSFRHAGRGKNVVTHALRDVSLKLEYGETIGIVGESGCGKSTMAKILIGLVKPDSGQVLYKGENIVTASPRRIKLIRQQIQMIFQDPYAALNPCMTVEDLIEETLILNADLTKEERKKRVEQLMKDVGLSADLSYHLAQECSGGQCQRIGIARAIALQPELVICDEPVSALDMSVQSQILNLLKKLQKERRLSYIFISHDLSVIRHISDKVCVMYLGTVMEFSKKEEIYDRPLHPYTRCLLESVQQVYGNEEKSIIRKEVKSVEAPEEGCPFAPRCPECMAKCLKERPVLCEREPGHYVACHIEKELKRS